MASFYEDLDQFYLFFYYTMDKLLKLLNEYRLEKGVSEYTKYIPANWCFTHKSRYYDHYSWVISKKFWFIEWLVANDKLNKEWLFNIIRESCIFDGVDMCSESDYIIMYLAIGYNPIYFLTSMVK